MTLTLVKPQQAPTVEPVKPEPVGFDNPIAIVRDVLEKNGWKRFSFGDPDEGFCLLGACRYANGVKHRATLNREYRRFKKVLGGILNDMGVDGTRHFGNFGRIAHFNDDLATRREIDHVLDRAEEVYVSRYRH